MLLLYILQGGEHLTIQCLIFVGQKLKSYYVNGPMICTFHKNIYICVHVRVYRVHVCVCKQVIGINTTAHVE